MDRDQMVDAEQEVDLHHLDSSWGPIARAEQHQKRVVAQESKPRTLSELRCRPRRSLRQAQLVTHGFERLPSVRAHQVEPERLTAFAEPGHVVRVGQGQLAHLAHGRDSLGRIDPC